MRIQDVVKKTGLQKRTIYYYIDEKLIEPAVDQKNGYRDFSEDDVQKLTIIRKLRDAGLPLSDIRVILAHPRTTSFFLHKQLNHLQSSLTAIEETMKTLDQFAAQFPVCNSLEQLSQHLSLIEFRPDISSSSIEFEQRDARLIANFLWQAYMDGPMTEYRQFLWQKIMQYTQEHAHTDLKAVVQYLEYLPPENVDAATLTQYMHNQEIITLNEQSYPQYVEQMKQTLIQFSKDSLKKEQWNLLYEPVIRPITVFAYNTSKWLLEFHPNYQRFYQNIHACCMMLKEYMDHPEGQEFRKVLEDAFGGDCNFEASSYGELEIAASFDHSIYTLLQPEEIKKILHTIQTTE